MLEYYSQHPLYAVLVAALAIVAVIVLIKAIKTSSRRSKEVNRLMEKMKKENELINRLAVLTQDIIEEAQPGELFRGVGLNLQKRVSQKPDMKEEFFSLNDSQRFIYAMSIFIEDAEKGMSGFFKLNTKPLTEYAAKAVEIIMPEEFKKAFFDAYNATDEDNEEVSFSREVMEETDKKAAPFIEDGTVSLLCGKYIKDNYSDFT